MSQQRCSELESKLQQQHERLSVANPVNIIETARAEAIADLEQVLLLLLMIMIMSMTILFCFVLFCFVLSRCCLLLLSLT